ncbi:hypothetical protein QVD17_37148 [Tagetes erecta]|uniref:2-oxoglutarate-dependent dioxygenase DAO n=1 Tax=Tagetes erecta TaxID=13708 RepID=A0AAD8NJK6_TARER|nr:hypothetical protein QVD17_37148 [Tagetes erecta]
MATKCTIPTIDLHDFPNQLSKLITTCEDWGCFRLLNHHDILPATLMSEMKAVVTSLFDLPVDIKRQNVDVITASGYTAPTNANPLHETLGFYDMASRCDIDIFCDQLDTTSHQRETIIRYIEAVYELFMDIAKKLAEGLGVKSENIGFENWPCQFRLNKYHFTSPQSVGSSGITTHTDSGFLTIVQDDDDVNGLEVMTKSGDFIPVDPWPDTLVVNMGDMATVLSNGRFCNVKHRVRCKETKTRVSIASFLLGPRGTVESLPELVDEDHPRKYVPTTFEDYRKLRFSTKLHAGEALELLYAPTSDKVVASHITN